MKSPASGKEPGDGLDPLAAGQAIVFDYDLRQWPLRGIIEEALGDRRQPLERLHELPLPEPGIDPAEHGLVLADQIREALGDSQLDRFAAFVHEVLPAVIGGPVQRHQRLPVIRVHLHGGHSISGFHRDRDWGQGPEVWNLWLPFTDVWGTNGIWVESEEGAGDEGPVELRHGQALVFRGADLRHGSLRNKTGSTRVSCDIRFARL